MSKQYYTWAKSYKSKAQGMLDAINNHEKLPLVGMRNGKPAPDKQMTIKWADGLTEWVDTRFGFQKIPDEVLDKMGITQEERDAMIAAFKPRIDNAEDRPLTVQQQYAIDNPSEF